MSTEVLVGDESAMRCPLPDGEEGTARYTRSLLIGVLPSRVAEPSAHQRLTEEQETPGSIAQLAEYEMIAAAAQRDRWATLLHSCELTADEVDGPDVDRP